MRGAGNNSPFYKTFLVVAWFCLLASCLFPEAAGAADFTIGVIMTGDISYYRDVHESFMAKLKKDGYGDRVDVILQKPYPDSVSLSNAARKLIAHEVDVILAYGTPAALAVSREKSRIPLIYAGVYEPLVQRVASKNSTGVSMKLSLSSLVRYLKGMGTIKNIGVIYSSNEEDSLYQMKELENIFQQYGLTLDGINLKRHHDVKAALKGKKPDALFITGSSTANLGMASIMDFAREAKVPTASLLPDRNFRIIVALYANPKEMGELSAEKIIRALREQSADRIKSSSARDIELIFDMKELLNMGLTIPMDLVTGATKIIQ